MQKLELTWVGNNPVEAGAADFVGGCDKVVSRDAAMVESEISITDVSVRQAKVDEPQNHYVGTCRTPLITEWSL